MNSSNDDCYFYYYSTCTKGNVCPYRHCELALGTEVVCTAWRGGYCQRKNCKFRHMESRINRTEIQCYWEKQPGGCRKPHCVFFHTKSKSATKTEIILPTAGSGNSSMDISLGGLSDVCNDIRDANSVLTSPTPAIQPIVVNLNDGEESDTESMPNTPVKDTQAPLNSVIGKRELNFENNLGIKTLEQLKMEKIHRESEHFYMYDSETPKTTPAKSLEVSVQQDSYGDLRKVIAKRKESSKPTQRLNSRVGNNRRFNRESTVSLKRLKEFNGDEKNNVENGGELNFQIKTLAEIKKEKEKFNSDEESPPFKKQKNSSSSDEGAKQNVLKNKPRSKCDKLIGVYPFIRRPVRSPPPKLNDEPLSSASSLKTDETIEEVSDGLEPTAVDSEAKISRSQSLMEATATEDYIIDSDVSLDMEECPAQGEDTTTSDVDTKVCNSANSIPSKDSSTSGDNANNPENGGLSEHEIEESGIESPKEAEVKATKRLGSIDEFDQLLMDTEADVPLNSGDNAHSGEKTEDIFSELEEMLLQT